MKNSKFYLEKKLLQQELAYQEKIIEQKFEMPFYLIETVFSKSNLLKKMGSYLTLKKEDVLKLLNSLIKKI